MKYYHKIENIFNRDIEGTKKLILGDFRSETVKALNDIEWVCTEKIDGTNIGIVWNGHEVSYIGRTERSDIPPRLKAFLDSKFHDDYSETIFEQLFGEKQAILFGEGYGGKIQKGSHYSEDEDFILFDVYFLESDIYSNREFVEVVAKALDVKIVPIAFVGKLHDAVRYIRKQPQSFLSENVMEGVVARPRVELRDNQGKRIIVKIKVADYKEWEGKDEVL